MGCKFSISVVDEDVVNGLLLLRDFLAGFSVVRAGRDRVERVVNALAGMLSDGYVPLTSVSTLVRTNALEQWESYRGKFEEWLNKFVSNHCFSVVGLQDLPSNYKARVAFEFLVVLAKDIIENHSYDLTGEVRNKLVEPSIPMLGVNISLQDVVVLLYPYALSTYSTVAPPLVTLSQFSENWRSLYNRLRGSVSPVKAHRVYSIMYLPLTLTGLIAESTLPEYEGFVVTGAGQNLYASMALAMSFSLNYAYYEYILNNLIGVAKANMTYMKYYLTNTLTSSIDPFSVMRGLVDEYYNVVDAYVGIRIDQRRLTTLLNYNMGNASRDMAGIGMAIISQHHELTQSGLGQKYIYIPTPTEEAIRNIIRNEWFLEIE